MEKHQRKMDEAAEPDILYDGQGKRSTGVMSICTALATALAFSESYGCRHWTLASMWWVLHGKLEWTNMRLSNSNRFPKLLGQGVGGFREFGPDLSKGSFSSVC